MEGYLTVFAFTKSGYEMDAYFNVPIPQLIDNKHIRKLPVSLPISNPDVVNFIKKLKYKNVNILDEITPLLKQQNVENFYWDNNFPFYIFPNGFDLEQGNTGGLTTFSKSGKRVKDLINKDSYISPKTFFKRYKIKGVSNLNLPYTNYDTNDVEDRCVYEFVKSKYTKISKKAMAKHFDKDEVFIDDIDEFCNKYKISSCIRNVSGKVIYHLDNGRNKNHPEFNAIVANHHLYPCNCKTSYPNKHTNLIKDELLPEDTFFPSNILEPEDVVILENNRLYSNDGYMKLDGNISDTFDKEFFSHIHPNFNYQSETVVYPISLNYGTGELPKVQIDHKKAYFNVYMNRIPDNHQLPIFTCMNLWEEFVEGDELELTSYYLISKPAMDNLVKFGFRNNFASGYMIDYLIEKDYIDINDVTHHRRPELIQNWSLAKGRLKQLAYKINPMPNDEGLSATEQQELFSQWDTKCNKFMSEYAVYNGILGRKVDRKVTQILNIHEDDLTLLNWDENDKWNYDGGKCYSKIKDLYRYLNTRNIYDTIVEQTNLCILKDIDLILSLPENKGAKLVKIKTDAIAFDTDIKIPDEISKWYKYETQKLAKPSTPIFIDGDELIKNISQELKSVKDNNVSYQGSAGSGKTTTVKNNHSYDIACAMTNMCATNIEGQTITSLFAEYDASLLMKKINNLKDKSVWIDEISMVAPIVWNYVFISSKKGNTKYILSGDFNQIGCIGHKKADPNSTFFNYMLGDKNYLTKDYRNDKGIIQLREIVKNTQNNSELINYINNITDKDNNFIKYDRHLCFTHIIREAVNQAILNDRGYTYKHIIEDDKYIKLVVSDNVILKAKTNVKKFGIFNGEVWKVINTEENGIINLTSLSTNKSMKLDKSNGKHFTLGFCMTTHSSQGLTIKDDMCIHEASKMVRLDKDILYTAITRGCNIDKLHMYNYTDELYYQEIDYIKTEPDYAYQYENPYDDAYCNYGVINTDKTITQFNWEDAPKTQDLEKLAD